MCDLLYENRRRERKLGKFESRFHSPAFHKSPAQRGYNEEIVLATRTRQSSRVKCFRPWPRDCAVPRWQSY